MPRHKEFDREEVVLKAMMVFWNKGYEASSMQDLVDRMKINRFSLYETFKSKHELFLEALQAYYENVAIPFFHRLKDSTEGLKAIESILMELVSGIKSGQSSNGCLMCNTIAELGARKDKRTTIILEKSLKAIEGCFYEALSRARQLGEISKSVNASEYAKVLVGYTTGLLIVAKVLSEKEMRKSVKAAIGAIK